MPADSDTTLPITYRPLGARVESAVAAGAIVFIVTFLWVLLPGEVREDFSVFQRVTLIGFFVVILVMGTSVGAVIGVDELTGTAINISTENYRLIEMFIVVAGLFA